ncbi:MAG: IPTL-CTERM sorting domain-containing protein [Acidobacteriota bacterium]|nr:IPTL-CTERM sorting domain-containing protein [Acidobacteriota bacterium]
MKKFVWVLLFFLLLSTGSLFAQSDVNTIPSWNGTDYIWSFGVPDTATYGQTITVGVNAGSLNSFAFQIGNCSADVSLRASIYAWNGTMATGSSLWQSSLTTVSAGSGFQLVSFTTGGLTLSPGSYVLFASTSQDQSGASDSACQWGSIASGIYSGGNFVYQNNGTNISAWTSLDWSQIESHDLAFRVTFGPAPANIPTLTEWGLILLACGLAFIAFRRLSSASSPTPLRS